MTQIYRLFLVAPPGLEHLVQAEAIENGFTDPKVLRGGVEVEGTINDLWSASLNMRGPARILLRVGEFRAMHLAQLDKRSRKLDWAALIKPDTSVSVEATCHKSKIYHGKAAAQRVAKSITEVTGAQICAEATLRVKVRIDDDMCTISLDTTGAALHLRGHKGGMGKAPLRENLAALCLRACGFQGGAVVDPMCGSGTFITEAAEISHNFQAGRDRNYAFADFAGFDPDSFAPLRKPASTLTGPVQFFGSDRDAGAVKMATDNAKLAGVSAVTQFTQSAFSDLTPPEIDPGLVIVNPPYGARIGNRKQLFGLYGALGAVMKERFQEWKFGMITSDPGLAKSTGLDWSETSAPFSNGGLKIVLYQAQL